MSVLLNDLASQLHPLHEPQPSPMGYKHQAAVLILLSDDAAPSILFTRRAQHLRRHPGEVCFPGGMWEPQDGNLLATALRETHEEIGLPASEIRLLGRMNQTFTRAATAVTPFVGVYSARYPLNACAVELESIFSVPLKDFLQGIQVREDCFEREGKLYRVPVYHYESYEIWGFTAAITARLLKLIKEIL